MTGPHLIYFADPMCSWCWGFSPVIEQIKDRFGESLPIRLVMGGLRPGTREPMTEAAKAEMRAHWDHVHEASGQPFDYAFFEREGFVYNTEPSARAVVVLGREGAAAGLAALGRIQAAFYAENRDVASAEVLGAIARELGHDADRFREAFSGAQAREQTLADYALTQQAGIRGFPTLIANDGRSERYHLVTHGYQPAERILASLHRWRERLDLAS